MRVFFGIVILSATVGVLAASFVGCGGDSEPIHAKCKNFCEGVVDAMDDSDDYDISDKDEAEKACLEECTDSIEGIHDKDLQEDVEDCVECVGDEAGSGSDWEDFVDAYIDDCEDECWDDDGPDPWDEFFNDFMEDFSEHFSYGSGGDADTDSDSDSDCDTGALEDCFTEWSNCNSTCADQECLDACLSDFCDCAYAADCAEYVSDYCY